MPTTVEAAWKTRDEQLVKFIEQEFNSSSYVPLWLTTHISLSPIRRGFAPGFVNYRKRCTRHAAASDKDYQLLAHGRWFSPGTPASSTTKTGRHDIAEILLKVALKHQKSNQIIFYFVVNRWFTLPIVVLISSFFHRLHRICAHCSYVCIVLGGLFFTMCNAFPYQFLQYEMKFHWHVLFGYSVLSN